MISEYEIGLEDLEDLLPAVKDCIRNYLHMPKMLEKLEQEHGIHGADLNKVQALIR